MLKALLTMVLFALCPLSLAQQSLNNDAVIRMAKGGVSDDLIITAINSQSGAYDTSPNGLISLKAAGVSDKVVAALIQKSSGNSTSATNTQVESSPFAETDSAVSYKHGEQWIDVDAERVDLKAGVLGAMVPGKTANVVGRISGKSSKTRLTPGTVVRVSVPAGGDIADCQLVRLHLKGDGREFHLAGGGFMKYQTGPGKDAVSFDSKKTGIHLFEVVLPPGMEPGEYGWIVAGPSKIFTFSISQ